MNASNVDKFYATFFRENGILLSKHLFEFKLFAFFLTDSLSTMRRYISRISAVVLQILEVSCIAVILFLDLL